MKKNTIRLTESELRTMIKEAVTKIITESSYDTYDIEIELPYVVEYFDSQIDEFFDNNNCPDTVDVELMYDIEPYDKGDYYTPPYGGWANIYDYKIDTDGKFKNIMPPELYPVFIKGIEEYLDKNVDKYSEEIYDNYENYEPDYEDYYD